MHRRAEQLHSVETKGVDLISCGQKSDGMTVTVKNGKYPFVLPSAVINKIACNRFEFLLTSELT
jgi:hypothetical protein